MISSELRAAIIEAYHGICQYCRKPAAEPHIDHIEPRAHGGSDSLANLILACAECNQRKGDGQLSPYYLGLMTSIAASTARRVESILRKPTAKWYWVNWRNADGDQYMIRINDPPQMADYNRLHAACDEWIARCDSIILRRQVEWALRAIQGCA